jgi:hypothetical protein
MSPALEVAVENALHVYQIQSYDSSGVLLDTDSFLADGLEMAGMCAISLTDKIKPDRIVISGTREGVFFKFAICRKYLQ